MNNLEKLDSAKEIKEKIRISHSNFEPENEKILMEYLNNSKNVTNHFS